MVVAVVTDSTESFAYADVVPIPTRSVVVESLMILGNVQVQPPPEEPPEAEIEAQDTKPEPSV